MKRLLGLILVVITVLTFPMVAFAEEYTFTTDRINLRDYPSTEFGNVLCKVSRGDKIEMIEYDSDWSLLVANGYMGYVSSQYIALDLTSCRALAGITTTGVNFRSGPDTSYHSYGVLSKNTIVKVLDDSSLWYKVDYRGVIGYIRNDFLTTKEIEGENILGVFTTKFSTGSSQKGRVKNIKKGAGLINEYIINPGETFSLLGAIGPITKGGGYFEAPEFKQTKNGTETVQGYGGGVCQIATTLYQSVLHAQKSGASIKITEHHHHSKSVSYVKDGEDATISWNAKDDFRFENNNSYSIRIRTYVEGNHISCMIYKMD